MKVGSDRKGRGRGHGRLIEHIFSRFVRVLTGESSTGPREYNC